MPKRLSFKPVMIALAAVVVAAVAIYGSTVRDAYASPLNSTDFVTTWRVEADDTSITIPTSGAGYNYNVDWDNDGEIDQSGITGSATHDFGAPGEYTIRINGAFPSLYSRFAPAEESAKLIDIDQWGTNQWTRMTYAFTNSSLSAISATDSPDLSGVTSMAYMFYGAGDFNSDISGWDVSNVKNMSYLFRDAASFNSDISDWDVSSVTNMTGMFYGASRYNQDLAGWDVSNVTNMSHMFREATAFNGDVSDWDVSSVTNVSYAFQAATAFNSDVSAWDVGSVTNAYGMFYRASTFSSDLSRWNVSRVTNMSGMFAGASSFNSDISNWDTSSAARMNSMLYGASAFNQDLSNWDISSIVDMDVMLSLSNLSRRNYEATLAGWSRQQEIPANITLGASGLSYCNSAARDTLVNDHGWTITGDSQDCDPSSPTIHVKGGTGSLSDHPIISTRPTFTGTAEPGAVVEVTVHSDPVICETTADVNGNWSCTLDKDLELGNHTVRVVVTLPGGGVQELGPYSVTVAGDDGGISITDDTPPTTDDVPNVPNTGLAMPGLRWIVRGAGASVAMSLVVVGAMVYGRS